jgi:hypothetical protein
MRVTHLPTVSPAAEEATTSSSQADLPCDLLRARRGADLNEEPVRLAQRVLSAGFVAGQASELGALELEERLVALCSRPLDPSGGFDEAFISTPRTLANALPPA